MQFVKCSQNFKVPPQIRHLPAVTVRPPHGEERVVLELTEVCPDHSLMSQT